MKIAYFDLIAGASGDMFLGALLDAGLPEDELRRGLAGLLLGEVDLMIRRVQKNGLSAVKVDVLVTDEPNEHRLAELLAMVEAGELPNTVKERAVGILRRLAEVEARIHDLPVDEVQLHELGGLDTLVDVVGTLCGVAFLGFERIFASPVPLGRGFIQSAHGRLPLPAPATVALLEGAPVVGSDLEVELVTPTGAVLLTALVESYGPIPPMVLHATGYGAGARDLPIPNVLRVLVGESAEAGATVESLYVLATNIDDLNPELYDYVIGRLFAAGALDVTLAQVQMKKNRPAVQLEALCRPDRAEVLEAILFTETTTLGVRRHPVERRSLARRSESVETPFGPVRVKIAHWGEKGTKAAPEYEDCRRLAEQHHLPLWEIYQAAQQAAMASLHRRGGE